MSPRPRPTSATAPYGRDGRLASAEERPRVARASNRSLWVATRVEPSIPVWVALTCGDSEFSGWRRRRAAASSLPRRHSSL